MPFSFSRLFLGKKATIVDEDALPYRPREVVPMVVDVGTFKTKFRLTKIGRALKQRLHLVSVLYSSQSSRIILDLLLHESRQRPSRVDASNASLEPHLPLTPAENDITKISLIQSDSKLSHQSQSAMVRLYSPTTSHSHHSREDYSRLQQLPCRLCLTFLT